MADSPKRQIQPETRSATPRRSSVVKGTKYILLRNREDLTDKKDIDRLNAALELNRDLSVAYYLKEDARLIRNCDSRQQAESQLDTWLVSASSANIPELSELAETIDSHRTGILAYHDKPTSTGPVEGILATKSKHLNVWPTASATNSTSHLDSSPCMTSNTPEHTYAIL